MRTTCESQYQEGVGILLSKRAKNGLIDWKSISSRLMTARFKGRIRNVTIVQCYASTEDTETVLKTSFYSQLQDTMRQGNNRKDILIIEDRNAKIGSKNLEL